MISCRIKKAIVAVTQLITALISIHSSMTFLADMYSFLDPPGRTVLNRAYTKLVCNRDEGSYQLSRAYDHFLDVTADRRIKTQKN